jgi:primosomal protein N' (replication factor Y)
MIEAIFDTLPTPIKNLKPLAELVTNEVKLTPPLLKLFRWVYHHYFASPGEVLRSFFPAPLLQGKSGKGKRAKIPPPISHFSAKKKLALIPSQQEAFEKVKSGAGTFKPYLLQGITGSGKTEIYIKLCEALLPVGKSVLVLVPEISLTPQTMARFHSHFGDWVGTYHSSMTEGQRLKTWWDIYDGRIRVLVGTRSSVFLPMKDLGLIIVDEEHDPSYKQEERFRYQGRDVAVVRAKGEGIPVLLGSATPSMESLENVQKGKYLSLLLPERPLNTQLPQIHLIDLKKQPADPATMLSLPLSNQLNEVLSRGEQALLFLNRRGFAPLILCRDCGEVSRCPNCEISLTFHCRPKGMICHYCDYSTKPLDTCPKCQGDRVEPVGTGTERLEENLATQFPNARIARLDRDVITSRRKTEEVLTDFAQGKTNLLIGTQMIAKGHDFKRVTLVGILLADHTLNLPDFRAAERAFQLLTQVSGRAGRHDLSGEVYLQTYRPEHYAILAAITQKPEEFFIPERKFREETGYPPFARIVLLKFLGLKPDQVQAGCRQVANRIQQFFKNHPALRIDGPSQPIFEKLKGKYRWQIMLRSHKYEWMRRGLAQIIPECENNLPAGVKLQIDVDPVGMF